MRFNDIFLLRNNVFGLYVRGDSMKDANIATGDLLFVDPDVEAKNGRMVVALVEGEPTVKWFQKEGYELSHLFLQIANTNPSL